MRLQDTSLASALKGQAIPDSTGVNTTDPAATDPSQMCPHNNVFFAAPNAQEVIQQQALQLQQMQQAAQNPPPAVPETPAAETE